MKALVLLLPVSSGEAPPRDRWETPTEALGPGPCGRVRAAVPGVDVLPDDGSALLLALTGADPRRERPGRGACSAAGLGLTLAPDDLALELALLTDGHRPSPLSAAEERLLIEAVNGEYGREGLTFVPGRAGRHVLHVSAADHLDLRCQPPWHASRSTAPGGADGPALAKLMDAARPLLAAHDVNRVRRDLGEPGVDRLWAWGPGRRLVLEPYALRTGRRLGVLADDPGLAGLAVLLGAHRAGPVEDADGLAAALDGPEGADLLLAPWPSVTHDLRGLARLLDRGDLRLLAVEDRPDEDGCAAWAAWGPGLSAGSAAASDPLIEPAHALIDYVVSSRHGDPGDRMETPR